MVLTAAATALGISTPAAAQQADGQRASDRLNVFLECGGRGCDLGFYQDRLTWVNWVGDPEQADVVATLSAEAATAAVRRVLAIHRVLHEDAGP